jgi:hypothetical protein
MNNSNNVVIKEFSLQAPTQYVIGTCFLHLGLAFLNIIAKKKAFSQDIFVLTDEFKFIQIKSKDLKNKKNYELHIWNWPFKSFYNLLLQKKSSVCATDLFSFVSRFVNKHSM